jgi:hypothetical protein
MTDLHNQWAKVEAALKTLLPSLSTLTEEERAQVLHYVDHNEHGLALEELCFALRAREAAIAPSQSEAIVELQTMMKLRNFAEIVSHLVRG